LTTIIIGARLEHASWELALRLAPEAWWGQRTAGIAAASRQGARRRVRRMPTRVHSGLSPNGSANRRSIWIRSEDRSATQEGPGHNVGAAL
jgi:hypothetical protein